MRHFRLQSRLLFSSLSLSRYTRYRGQRIVDNSSASSRRQFSFLYHTPLSGTLCQLHSLQSPLLRRSSIHLIPPSTIRVLGAATLGLEIEQPLQKGEIEFRCASSDSPFDNLCLQIDCYGFPTVTGAMAPGLPRTGIHRGLLHPRYVYRTLVSCL